MAYTFEYEDVTVTVERPLVRTSLDADHLRNKILIAYGHVSGNPASDNRIRRIVAYTEIISRTTVSAPVSWWAHPDMTNNEVRAAFEAFLEQEVDLAEAFDKADDATTVPKKTTPKAPVTSQ
jgi:hypothetical protein